MLKKDTKPKKDAEKFWCRYKCLVLKDLPVIIKAGIQQSTLSTWKKRKAFPRANEAVEIARAVNTTVEYLVTGQDTERSPFSAEVMEIAVIADRLNSDGLHILKSVAESLELKYSQKAK